MNASDIIDRVQENLNRSDATTTLVLNFLNIRQIQICNLENFSFMEADYSVSTVADTQSYAFPTSYKDELHMWLVDDNVKTPLIKWVGSEAERSYSQTDKTGKPQAYWIWDGKYWLYPIPDGVYTLKLKYYEYMDDLTDVAEESNELCKYWADLLINGATADGFHYFQQPDKAAEWEAKYNAEVSRLMRMESKRKYAFYNPRLKVRVK